MLAAIFLIISMATDLMRSGPRSPAAPAAVRGRCTSPTLRNKSSTFRSKIWDLRFQIELTSPPMKSRTRNSQLAVLFLHKIIGSDEVDRDCDRKFTHSQEPKPRQLFGEIPVLRSLSSQMVVKTKYIHMYIYTNICHWPMQCCSSTGKKHQPRNESVYNTDEWWIITYLARSAGSANIYSGHGKCIDHPTRVLTTSTQGPSFGDCKLYLINGYVNILCTTWTKKLKQWLFWRQWWRFASTVHPTALRMPQNKSSNETVGSRRWRCQLLGRWETWQGMCFGRRREYEVTSESGVGSIVRSQTHMGHLPSTNLRQKIHKPHSSVSSAVLPSSATGWSLRLYLRIWRCWSLLYLVVEFVGNSCLESRKK